MQAVHPMFGADEMSSTLVSSFTPAERRMHSSPAARQPVPWRTMLSAGLFVSGACVGYAMAVFQHTQHTPVPTVPLVEQKAVPVIEQKVEQFYAGIPLAITSRRSSGASEHARQRSMLRARRVAEPPRRSYARTAAAR